MPSNDEVFEKTKLAYRGALNKSGFREKLSYTSAQNKNDKNDNKQQNRKIIWHNPPYSENIKTNIGKTFLKVIKNTSRKRIKSMRTLIRTL